jgi:hypothetical protein
MNFERRFVYCIIFRNGLSRKGRRPGRGSRAEIIPALQQKEKQLIVNPVEIKLHESTKNVSLYRSARAWGAAGTGVNCGLWGFRNVSWCFPCAGSNARSAPFQRPFVAW